MRKSRGLALREVSEIVEGKLERLVAVEEMLSSDCCPDNVPWVMEPVFDVVVKLLRPTNQYQQLENKRNF